MHSILYALIYEIIKICIRPAFRIYKLDIQLELRNKRFFLSKYFKQMKTYYVKKSKKNSKAILNHLILKTVLSGAWLT